jgi:hypothetical protein
VWEVVEEVAVSERKRAIRDGGMSTEFQVERDREIPDGHILITHTLVMTVDPLNECNGTSRGISQMVLAKWWTRMEWSMS